MRPKAGHSMMQNGLLHIPQKYRKRGERREVGMGIGHYSLIDADNLFQTTGSTSLAYAR